jgi:hypothetical protein
LLIKNHRKQNDKLPETATSSRLRAGWLLSMIILASSLFLPAIDAISLAFWRVMIS